MMDESEYREWLNTFCNADLVLNSRIAGSFRVNTLKIPLNTFEEISNIKRKKVSWDKSAFILDEKLQLGRTFEYFLGYLHTQSLSSMVPPLVLEAKKRENILDLTAAPGSKTTQISALMENTGIVVANDLPERELALLSNVERLGALNVMITKKDARDYPLKEEFDKVLVDAPCTAIGANTDAYKRFTINDSVRISPVQKNILLNGFNALKKEGTLVYSTCTYSEMENEEVVSHLLNNKEDAELIEIDLDIPHHNGLDDLGSELKKCWRIYPNHLNSDGFFIAKIRKADA